MVKCLFSDRETYFHFRLKLTRLTRIVNIIYWNYAITLAFLVY